MNLKNKAITDAYENKFIIPLDFEMLDSTMPYYQSGLGNRLCYEITFNNYNQVILSPTALTPPKVLDANYKISDISLGYEIVTQPDLASCITMEYQRVALPCDRIIRNRQIPVNKSNTMWNWSLTSLVSY